MTEFESLFFSLSFMSDGHNFLVFVILSCVFELMSVLSLFEQIDFNYNLVRRLVYFHSPSLVIFFLS